MTLRYTEYPYIDSATLFDGVADEPWAMLLDSGFIDGKSSSSLSWGYDVLAIRPSQTFVFNGGVTQHVKGDQEQTLAGDPLRVLQQYLPDITPPECPLVPYVPGGMGYFSYDLARHFEPLPSSASNDEQLPPMAVGVYDVLLVVDHAKRRSVLVEWGDEQANAELVETWGELIEAHSMVSSSGLPARSGSELHPSVCGGLQCTDPAESLASSEYQAAFDKVRQYTIDGDCYQVNLTNQFSAKVSGRAWLTYRYLRAKSPAPYGAYLNLPFAQILSNSPESFIQCHKQQVTTSPIKGTRPRVVSDPKRDADVAAELLSSAKDRAENVMIVDLMRNDLSRCCELGSVAVPELFALHSFANVHHLISRVTGRLKHGLHSLDLLRHCFPGGSITGAPKIRAMQIIEELEPVRRGLYCGSIGFIGGDGSLETNIAIRTIVVKDGVARFAAGGGLVIDSELDAERQELEDKANMMRDALFGDNLGQ
ncbi:para-aminobenzoate synthetase component 1 [Arenicella xantha]|uniref:aminodeoxychorismate synthase n=1 Tax=Arenicella xantha TaxID=644221 RepID=A0A395JHS1_9GAMM|nr:para-aminobenzoate synthetase component 1 [Arenicella xantha]